MMSPTKDEIRNEMLKVLKESRKNKQPTQFELDIQKGKIIVLAEHWKTLHEKEAV
jgi:hypothetical protein